MSAFSDQSIADANALKECFKGLGMKSSVLIDILTKRSVTQVLEIANAYKANFGKTLDEKIGSEASGNFGKLAKGLVMHPAEYDAQVLYHAMKGLGTDEDVLIEVLVGRTPIEISAIKAAYTNLYQKDLEKVVTSETSGDLKKFLTVLLCGSRDDPGVMRDVAQDVETLYKAGEGRMGTEEIKFIQIVGNRSDAHMTEVIRQYALKYGHDLLHALKNEFSGDIRKALTNTVRSLQNRPLYFAELFEKSMHGLGTNDEMLVRLLVRNRYPKIMAAIKEAYLQKYGKTLAHRIAGETSGDYKKLAVGLVDAAP
ncbi:the Annexin Xii hexamer [Gonapodya prolifera JEL478]|uniref:Annexin n=1 Tax=Gonapodya prolifera (strain JEL478) TaxID=1344416 RepID=A0A139A697_GONPJ|nr:the Annexin Xii hexamer [Gonapodya prolifera JEL478]|eukprot:KXS12332.1 the Annexin Xii hexamer [Gonapodya prolifera JEL478]